MFVGSLRGTGALRWLLGLVLVAGILCNSSSVGAADATPIPPGSDANLLQPAFNPPSYTVLGGSAFTATLVIPFSGPTPADNTIALTPGPFLSFTGVVPSNDVNTTCSASLVSSNSIVGIAGSGDAGTCSLVITVLPTSAIGLPGGFPSQIGGTVGMYSAFAPVFISNPPPTATNSEYPVTAGTPFFGTLAGSVTGGSGAYNYALVSPPTHGAFTLDPTGAYTYTPAAGYSGDDSFTWFANDFLFFTPSNVATVTFHVSAPPSPSPTATDTPTITPSPTATDTPTITPSPTATDTPTITPSATATDTPTITPSATATNTPTLVPSATTTPTQEPNATPVTATSTTMPTSTVAAPTSTSEAPTSTAEATGAVTFTLSTADGGPVPDSTTVCVGTVCQSVGASISAAAVSPTTLTFSNLDPGTYAVTVTDAAPYQDASGSVVITGGETTSSAIVLQLAAVTVIVAPTQSGGATPIATGTTVPPTASAPGGVTPTPAGKGVNPAKPSAPAGGAKVTTLPNTGAGRDTSDSTVLLMFLAAAAVVGAGALGWRRRRIS